MCTEVEMFAEMYGFADADGYSGKLSRLIDYYVVSIIFHIPSYLRSIIITDLFQFFKTSLCRMFSN